MMRKACTRCLSQGCRCICLNKEVRLFPHQLPASIQLYYALIVLYKCTVCTILHYTFSLNTEPVKNWCVWNVCISYSCVAVISKEELCAFGGGEEEGSVGGRRLRWQGMEEGNAFPYPSSSLPGNEKCKKKNWQGLATM